MAAAGLLGPDLVLTSTEELSLLNFHWDPYILPEGEYPQPHH